MIHKTSVDITLQIMEIPAPIAKKIPHIVTFGNKDSPHHVTNDDYYWMRDDNRKDPEVINHLKSESDYTKNILESDPNDKKKYEELKANLKSHLNEDYESIKYNCGCQLGQYKYKYYYKNVKGKSHKLHYVEIIDRDTGDSQEHLMLDENTLKIPGSPCSIENFTITYHYKYMMYCVDMTGTEMYDLVIFDISNPNQPRKIDHDIPKILYGEFCVGNNENYIFYGGSNQANRRDSVYVCDIGKGVNKLLLRDDNNDNSVKFNLTSDKRVLIIKANSYNADNLYYLKLSDLKSDIEAPIHLVHRGIMGDKCSIEKIGDSFVILTNRYQETRFDENVLMYCKCDEECKMKSWSFIGIGKLVTKLEIKENDIMCIVSIKATHNHIIISIMHNGVTKIAYLKFNRDSITDYPFEHDWYVIEPNNDFGYLEVEDINSIEDRLILRYSSLNTPQVFRDHNMVTNKFRKIRDDNVPNYNQDLYTCRRIYCPSHDGANIPVTLVYSKDLNINTTEHKLHLYGYGSYGLNIEPDFNKGILPLIDNGFIYAIAHVRGSRTMGEQWYQKGKLDHKMNTFLDFRAVASYFIDNGYTSAKLMSCEGRSAGGLLMGYCVTQCSDLFNAIIAGVPFVDVLTTMSDESIPLTTTEWTQWGNPNIPSDYEYMLKYSPYDNLHKNISYPHVMATAGLNDPRVGYWEPAKFVAKLREVHKKDTPKMHLLKIDMNDGHFNPDDRYKWVDEKAKEILFLLKSLE